MTAQQQKHCLEDMSNKCNAEQKYKRSSFSTALVF